MTGVQTCALPICFPVTISHTKQVVINKEQAQYYLDHGAQPTDRVALLLKKEGVKLPKWVTLPAKQEGKIRNPEKLRKNQPKEETAPEQPKVDAEDTTVSDSESTESEQAEA